MIQRYLILICPRKFIACLLACTALATTGLGKEPPRKIALLVGVSDYFHKNMEDLSFAEDDVRAVGDELSRLGFETNVLTARQANRDQIETALENLLKTAATMESDGVVLLMFSGHGLQHRTVTGNTSAETPFFCPRDAIPFDQHQHVLRGKSADKVADEFNLVSLNRVISQLDQRSNSRQNLLIVDACRNNPAKGKAAGITGSTAVNLPQGISILFAARSGQKSWESADENIKHGVMTHYLLNGLRGKAYNLRKQLTWSRLVSHVREEVAFDAGKLAGGSDRAQTPHSITNNDAIIVLNDSIVPHFGPANLLRSGEFSVERFDPNVRYVIEFWPALSKSVEVKFRQHVHSVNHRASGIIVNRRASGIQNVIVFADQPARVESFLNTKSSDAKNATTISDSLAGVAICADPNRALADRYASGTIVKDQAEVLFLGKSQRRSWSGTLDAFNLDTQIEIDLIGATPPDLAVTEWHTDGEGTFAHDSRFKLGKIYVLALWATWLPPDYQRVFEAAKLQQKYRHDGVQIFSVAHEDPKDTNKYLDRRWSDKLRAAFRVPVRYKTPREALTNHCVVTSKISGLGVRALPFNAIVGPTGLIEWTGHNRDYDKPLQAVVDGTWDREAYRQTLLDISQFNEIVLKAQSELALGNTRLAMSLIDQALVVDARVVAENLDDSRFRSSQTHLLQALVHVEQLEKAENYASRLLVEFDTDTSPETSNALAWQIYELAGKRDLKSKQVIQDALSLAKKAVSNSQNHWDNKANALDTVAHLQYLMGDKAGALKTQSRAYELTWDSDKERLKAFLVQLRSEVTPHQDSHDVFVKAVMTFVKDKNVGVSGLAEAVPEYGRAIAGLTASEKMEMHGVTLALPNKETWNARPELRAKLTVALKKAGAL